MPQTADSKEAICSRFNALYWHDSKLLGLCVAHNHNDRTYDVRFRLSLYTDTPAGRARRSAELTFTEARLVQTSLDLLGMSYCGGDISDAFCRPESDLKTQLDSDLIASFLLPQPDKPLAELSHFAILMIHPGGKINVFAKDFVLEMLPGT
jgi:hypothetical protein